MGEKPEGEGRGGGGERSGADWKCVLCQQSGKLVRCDKCGCGVHAQVLVLVVVAAAAAALIHY